MKQSKRKLYLAAAAVSGLAAWSAPASAATYIWDGGGANGNFSTADNWGGEVGGSFAVNTVPTFAGAATFDSIAFSLNSGGFQPTPGNTPNIRPTVDQLIFMSTAPTITMGGLSLDVMGKVVQDSANAMNIRVNTASGATLLYDSGSSSVKGDVVNISGPTRSFGTTSNANYNLTFTANYSLSAAAVTFTNNTPTTDNKVVTFAGITSGATSNTRTLTIAGTGRTVLGGALVDNVNGKLGLTVSNTGATYFNAVNTYTGPTTISGAGLIGGTGTISASAMNVTATNATFAPGVGPTSANNTAKLTLNGGLTLNNNTNFTFDVNGSAGAVDQLVLTGTVNFATARTYTVTLVDLGLPPESATLMSGQTYTLIDLSGATYTGATEANSTINFVLPSYFTLDTTYDANGYKLDSTGLTARFSAVPEPGSLIWLPAAALILKRRRSR